MAGKHAPIRPRRASLDYKQRLQQLFFPEGIAYDWSAWQKYHDRPDSDVVLVQAETVSLSPTFDANAIARAMEEDPASASAEYLAHFRTDVETFVSREAIDLCVVPDRLELPHVPGVVYHAFRFCRRRGGR